MLSYRAPSFGKFSTKLNTQYWFGTPRNVSMAGLQMDVDKYAIAVNDKNNQTANAVNYMQVIGSRGSAMEHLVPEQMFSTPEAPAQGISAVKALAIASAQGQKIWTISQNNLETAMAALQLDADSKAEIRAGVLAGNVVTAHEKPINFNGWVGEGYTIIDPQTGAGAYKIAGGGNGGEVTFAEGAGYVAGMLAIIGFSGGLGALGLPVIIGLIVVLSVLVIATIISVVIDNDYDAGTAALEFLCGFLNAIAVAGAVNGFASVLKGIVKQAVNVIGSAMTIAGVTLGVCSLI